MNRNRSFVAVESVCFSEKLKRFPEQRKNDFYSFIQIELMPVLNLSITHRWRRCKWICINSMNILPATWTCWVLMFKNHDAILAQDKVLTSLENIVSMNLQKRCEGAEGTTEVYRSFHSFNLYIDSVKYGAWQHQSDNLPDHSTHR